MDAVLVDAAISVSFVSLWLSCSGDIANPSGAPPTLFGLAEDEGAPTTSGGRAPKPNSLLLHRVAFAAEGARLMLFTEAGDLIVIGDGCRQQQLLSIHPKEQQQQEQRGQQQQDIWKAAAATIAPRFWVDRSRRQRLRGSTRIRVPHRKIFEVINSNIPNACCCCCCCCCYCTSNRTICRRGWQLGPQHQLQRGTGQQVREEGDREEPHAMSLCLSPCCAFSFQAAAGIDHLLLMTLPLNGDSHELPEHPLSFVKELHRPPPLLRCLDVSPSSSSSYSSSNISSSSSSSTADGTRLSSLVSNSSSASQRDAMRHRDTPTARPSAAGRSHSATPGSSSMQQHRKQQQQLLQQQQEEGTMKQLWPVGFTASSSNSSSSSSKGRSLAEMARDAAATGLQMTLRHLATAGEEAAKAAANKAVEAAGRVADGQGADVMERFLDRLDR